MRFALRRGTRCDGDAIGDVYSASFRLLTFLPMLHTVEDYKWFIANVILNECEVTVAEDESGIVAFLARHGEEIRLLYTRPDRIGMGAGMQLIDAAKATGIGALELLRGKRARTTLLRSPRLSRDPFYRWCGQRGADAEYPVSVGTIGPPWSQTVPASPRSGGYFRGRPRHNARTNERNSGTWSR
jgi:hypothetical protein